MRYAARFPEHPPKLVLQSTRDELARTSYNLDLLSDPGSVIRHIDLRPELARVTCPTLVIAGDVDPWGSVDAAAGIVAALPDPLVRYEQSRGPDTTSTTTPPTGCSSCCGSSSLCPVRPRPSRTRGPVQS
jgi:pimeloyl-ACP methyl ester carboxylesterase